MTYIVDTHALLWYLTSDRKLTSAARKAIDRRRDPDVSVLISAISIAELYYVNQKAGRTLDVSAQLERLERAGFELVPFESADVAFFERLAGIPEMHDRIIAALALRRGASLVTRDAILAEHAGVPVVW